MTTEQVLGILRERGLTVTVGNDGPALKGDTRQVTPALLKVLRIHRQEIIRRLAPVKAMECRWANGFIGRHAFPHEGWPTGAREWRYVGEDEWRAIPENERPTGRPRWLDPERGWIHDAGRISQKI